MEDGIGGVLCRCTGYLKIVDAVMEWPADLPGAKAVRRRRRAGCAVGARLPRVDGWPKVAGTDLFGADEAPADALWMRVVRSPHARARFTLGDLERRSRRAPRPRAILTAADVPGENSFGIFPTLKDQPVLAPGARALPRRGGAGAGRNADGGRKPIGRRAADRLDTGDAASPDRRGAGAEARRRCMSAPRTTY